MFLSGVASYIWERQVKALMEILGLAPSLLNVQIRHIKRLHKDVFQGFNEFIAESLCLLFKAS